MVGCGCHVKCGSRSNDSPRLQGNGMKLGERRERGTKSQRGGEGKRVKIGRGRTSIFGQVPPPSHVPSYATADMAGLLLVWRASPPLLIRGLRGENLGTPFPLLKCLRMHYRRIANHFSAKDAPDCRILHIQSPDFFGVIPPDSEGSDAPLLGPRYQFSAGLASVAIVPVLRNDHRCSCPNQSLWLLKNPLKRGHRLAGGACADEGRGVENVEPADRGDIAAERPADAHLRHVPAARLLPEGARRLARTKRADQYEQHDCLPGTDRAESQWTAQHSALRQPQGQRRSIILIDLKSLTTNYGGAGRKKIKPRT